MEVAYADAALSVPEALVVMLDVVKFWRAATVAVAWHDVVISAVHGNMIIVMLE